MAVAMGQNIIEMHLLTASHLKFKLYEGRGCVSFVHPRT